MGVYGLWRLLDASGKLVPVETLEGKVLAIDISIWIHQILQGYQDHHGNPKPNAHLLGLFNRICKLLYYKIKPVFVFDGGMPILKKNTIAARRKQKSIAMSKAQKMKADLINNLIKHTAVKTVLSKKSTNEKDDLSQSCADLSSKPSVNDMFKLPEMPNCNKIESLISDEEYDSDSSVQLSPRKQSKWIGNIHNVDVNSAEFKSLPPDVRYDILTDLKETRKQNSWGRLHEMPKESHEFSGFQMKRLLKRRIVQESLESAEKEMGGKTLTLEELDRLLTEQGIDLKKRDDVFRIASDNTTRLIYINDKSAIINNSQERSNQEVVLENADREFEPIAGPSGTVPIRENINEYQLNDWDSDMEITSPNNSIPIVDNINEYEIDSDLESEIELNESRSLSKKYFSKNTMNPALTYMLEHSGLSQEQIMDLIEKNKAEKDNNVNLDKKILISSKDSKKIQNTRTNAESENCMKTVDNNIIMIAPTSKIADYNSNADSNSSVDDFVQKTEMFDTPVNYNESNINNASSNKSIEIEMTSDVVNLKETINLDATDSDSSDFIEIPDVPIIDSNVPEAVTIKNNFEITIKSNETIEDDIFADIFEESQANTNLHVTTSLVKNSKKATDSQVILLQKNEDKSPNNNNALDIILEEDIEDEQRNEKDKSIQLEEEEEEINNLEEDSGESNNDVIFEADTHKLSDSKSELTVLPNDKDELLSLQAQLEGKQKELTENIGKLERQATDLSDQIRIEAQELLRLFGIPYIVAPMEAEAQCAYLEQIKLTDGTITDDSDIWLFGGQCVYKNFFNNKKRILQFQACDIHHHFKLTRQQMIQLALLVGSDYTPGVSGIGPVTGLEILAAFPAEGDNVLHGLSNFYSWIKSGRLGPGKTSLRNKLRNIQIEKGFPSQAVVQAYLFPTIDDSKENFTWGKPNIILLIDYARQKFGWTRLKFDEIMKPILKKIEETESQRKIESYFKCQIVPKSIEINLSKRVQKALQKLDNKVIEDNPSKDDIKKENKKSKDRPINKLQKNKKNDKDIEKSVNTKDVTNVAFEHCNKTDIKTDIKIDITTGIKEYIPQREKDKANSLKNKLRAIEVFRKSKRGISKSKKMKHNVRKTIKEAELSESSSSSS